MFFKNSTRKILLYGNPLLRLPAPAAGLKIPLYGYERKEGRRGKKEEGKDGISSCLHLFRRTEEGWQESEVPALRLKFASMSFQSEIQERELQKNITTLENS